MKLRERMQRSRGTASNRFLELKMDFPNYSKCHSFSKLVDSRQPDSCVP